MCAVAVAALATLALALPAGSSAASRLVVCLQGKAACTGANKAEVPVSPDLTKALLGVEYTGGGALFPALELCSQSGPQLAQLVRNLGVDTEICHFEGHWAFGQHSRTRVGNVVLRCGAPRSHNPAVSYRYCELETSAGETPYVLLEDNRNWPHPVLP